VELLLEDGVVEVGGGDGFRTGELLIELDAQLVPGARAGVGEGVAVEVVHGDLRAWKSPSQEGRSCFVGAD
jgi:16S rRNA A1518/A1519 N6-dimethyltransferase RsmA/KsgA/DIM1 with predicted DNA glycosylase/AP lyase activity